MERSKSKRDYKAAIKPSIPNSAPAATGTCVGAANPELFAVAGAAVLEAI